MQIGPVIKSLSVSTGQPGDFLLINGSGFAYGDEVHFIVAPGMDLKATVNAVGSDTVIMVNVPSVAGVGSYAGQIYVQSTGQNAKKSAGIHFDFVPTMEFVDLAPVETQPDAHIDRTDLASVCPGDRGVCRDGSNDFLGHKGDDILVRDDAAEGRLDRTRSECWAVRRGRLWRRGRLRE